MYGLSGDFLFSHFKGLLGLSVKQYTGDCPPLPYHSNLGLNSTVRTSADC